jgi:DNA-binding response OmpR family regulator
MLERMAEGGALPGVVVVVSSDRSRAKIDRLTALGAHYLPKPFRPEDLRAVLAQALAGRRAAHV